MNFLQAYVDSRTRPFLSGSFEQFLEQVARRGSWIGGGSVAAAGAALAAALLEKLLVHPRQILRLRARRRACMRLVERDAKVFARVIAAMRSETPRAFQRALKTAIEVPCDVHAHAQAVERAGRAAGRQINPRFQSDLRCALAFAAAAKHASRALIDTNLAWLQDRGYARRVRRRLRDAR